LSLSEIMFHELPVSINIFIGLKMRRRGILRVTYKTGFGDPIRDSTLRGIRIKRHSHYNFVAFLRDVFYKHFSEIYLLHL